MMNIQLVQEHTIRRQRRNPAGWLDELEPVAERQFHEHLRLATEWYPYEYAPWSRAQNFSGPLHGVTWRPEQSDLSPAVRSSLMTALLTEDNLPSYHLQAASAFGLDGVWGSGYTGGPPKSPGTAPPCSSTCTPPAPSTPPSWSACACSRSAAARWSSRPGSP
ncbi:acyl-ACP desaturase [Streptomyces mirabilis]|uniref:acyl-ACP desaturase n=1 Tax=Streptomyces mirabilis TaxID=68239 RepID=UPI0033C37B25